MNSHHNNQDIPKDDKKTSAPPSDPPTDENQFRTVCFDKSPNIRLHRISLTSVSPNAPVNPSKRNSSSTSSPHSHPVLVANDGLDQPKRARLDPSVKSTLSSALNSKTPGFIRRFRSRSLPIINYNQRHFHHQIERHHREPEVQPHKGTIPPLPPINLQLLKEIDLYEILKNPQLRHDILFDPQLQFRPNLDGERGKKKKSIIDRYWMEIQRECEQFFAVTAAASSSSTTTTAVTTSPSKIYRLPILFTTLRDILVSLLPAKDRQKVNEIMDIELMVQQLNHGLFDFVEMSEWLANVFKSHCAPMRDQWVVEMHQKFLDAYHHNSVDFLVSGLRLIFQILEAMKLDVANHQIRVLRSVLIETAVDFERDYFQTLITQQKININDSLSWLYKKFIKKSNLLVEEENEEAVLDDQVLKPVVVSLIIDLLSCRQMATEFPLALAFDHTRLVLLRADVRQLVCVQLCVVLYKQLAFNARKLGRLPLLSLENVTRVQQEILAIVTDDNGNVKWTKNILAISLQLVKNVQGDKDSSTVSLPPDMIEFSYNWLIKHIQPNSEVYGLMEGKIFKDLISEINLVLADDMSPLPVCTSSSTSSAAAPGSANSATELKSIAGRIATLVKFHWSVFRSYYVDYIRMQHSKIQQDRLNKGKIVLGNHVLDITTKAKRSSISASVNPQESNEAVGTVLST